jgi:hypothetical protein
MNDEEEAEINRLKPSIMNYDNSNAVKKGEVIDGYLRKLFEKFKFVQNYRTLISENLFQDTFFFVIHKPR